MSARESLARLALGEVGRPYEAHRDCSGFTAWAYRQIGVEIPQGSVAQFHIGQPVTDGLQVGDLLFWDTFGEAPGHVALYIGGGNVVHALNERRGIVESDYTAAMGGPYMGARRILPTDKTQDTPNPKPPRRQKRRHPHRKENR